MSTNSEIASVPCRIPSHHMSTHPFFSQISYRFMDVIKLATSKGIAVVITTQCLEGATLMHLYDVGRQALEAGAIQAYDMSTECTITKLMWALHRSKTVEEVRSIMHTNYTGEINVEGKLYGART